MNSRALGLLVAIFVLALTASADPISTITVGPDSTVIDSDSHRFTSPSFSGSLEEWVVSDTTNPFYPGALDFIFQVTDFSGSIQTVSIKSCCFYLGFDGGITTGYGSGTETPSSFSAALVGGLDGTSGPVFTFGSGMTVGTSVDLILQTGVSYDHPGFLYINGLTEGFAYGPLPEPRSIGLVLGVFFGLGLLLTRRFRHREI